MKPLVRVSIFLLVEYDLDGAGEVEIERVNREGPHAAALGSFPHQFAPDVFQPTQKVGGDEEGDLFRRHTPGGFAGPAGVHFDYEPLRR